jgi:hypothetical protein
MTFLMGLIIRHLSPLKTLGMNLIRQLGSKDFPGYNNCPVAIYAYAVYGG